MPVSELKPCPFCFDGGEPKLNHDTSSDYEAHWAWHVWCNECGAETDYRKDETAAVNLWNQRTPAALSQGALEWRALLTEARNEIDYYADTAEMHDLVARIDAALQHEDAKR